MSNNNIRGNHDKELKAAIESEDWKKLITSCQDYETDAAELNSLDDSTVPHYGVQMLGYLLVNDVCNARFLWKRIPAPIKKSDKELGNIWVIGKAMYKGDFAAVYKAISGSGFTGNNKVLAGKLEQSFRRRVVNLISSGYSSISAADTATALGLDEKQTEQAVTAVGWKKSGNFYTPAPPPSQKTQRVDLVQLQQLTDYFCFLSSKN